jgi:hypothetical protein
MPRGSFAAGAAVDGCGSTGGAPLGPEQPSPESVADTVLLLANEGDFYVGQVFTPSYGVVI